LPKIKPENIKHKLKFFKVNESENDFGNNVSLSMEELVINQQIIIDFISNVIFIL